MKYRADFVTNSSSTSYTMITVDFANGKSVEIGIDDSDSLDCNNFILSARFLKSIKSIDKLAAYLIYAYDYRAHDVEIQEIPESENYYMTGYNSKTDSFEKIFLEVGRDREGEKLVDFIENLIIDTSHNVSERKAKKKEDRDAFIKSCTKNAKTMQDIMRITVDVDTSFWGFSDSYVIYDAIERIEKENNIKTVEELPSRVVSDALYNSDFPCVKTVYTFDFAKDKHSHKTELNIDTGWGNQRPVIRIDKKYRFYSIFDGLTGEYYRSGIFKRGKDTGINPFMASFPHLVDVGIMGHCTHAKTGGCQAAGVGCYQSGSTVNKPNMALEDFKKTLKQCAGKVDQFALGGRGDPDMHENFSDILKLCSDYGIVPNFTTSGYGLTPKKVWDLWGCCGAVAVSWYCADYTEKAIQMLLDEGVKTNIHYVLSSKTIDEAISMLECDGFPKGINAVIFLLHKPIGLGSSEDVLNISDPRVQQFFALVDKGVNSFKIGVDSCTVPGIINHCKGVALESVDTCEGGRFSCYIGADMQMLPCSFDQNKKYAVDLRKYSIQQAWNSRKFNAFRSSLRSSCPQCPDRNVCMGGCPIVNEITLCNRKERDFI